MRSRRSRVIVPVLALAFVAGACGGSDGASKDTTAPAETSAAPATEAPQSSEAPASSEAAATTEAPAASTEAPAEEMTPVPGGTLTYLLEAESDTWDIPGANCAVACITVMRQVTDPLMIVNEKGEVEPFLLKSFEASPDFTTFTMTMRDGVTFHDGTPADGAAVQRSLQEMAKGILQGQVLMDLVGGPDGIELVDPMTVKVTFSRPFATFPYNIAERTGWLIAPSFWDNPDRKGAVMVGTGPFMMSEWVRGEKTVLTKNPNYWRKGPNGEQLPYLDSIEFRPVPDVATRRSTMEAGDADANQDSFGENKEFWTTEWLDNGGQLVTPDPAREVSYLMINNAAPPFDNPDMRRALAMCTNRQEYIDFRAPGTEIANGPFAKGSLGYMEDPGFPQFDPDAGNALLDKIGRPAEIKYSTTNVPSNLISAELFADQWKTNCGLTVNIDQFDQSELITKALTGSFQVVGWRNHGQGHPGLEFVWWHSRHTEGIALNFGRIKDPEIDALLEKSWSTTDLAELDDIGKQINQVFAKNVYNLWLNTVAWYISYQANVHGVGDIHLESGTMAQHSIAGRTWLAEAWKEA